MGFTAGTMQVLTSDKTGEVVARLDVDLPHYDGRLWGKAPDVAEVTDKTPEFGLNKRNPRTGTMYPGGALWRLTPDNPEKSKASHYYNVKIWHPPMQAAIWLKAFPQRDEHGQEGNTYRLDFPEPKPAKARTGSLDDASEPIG